MRKKICGLVLLVIFSFVFCGCSDSGNREFSYKAVEGKSVPPKVMSCENPDENNGNISFLPGEQCYLNGSGFAAFDEKYELVLVSDDSQDIGLVAGIKYEIISDNEIVFTIPDTIIVNLRYYPYFVEKKGSAHARDLDRAQVQRNPYLYVTVPLKPEVVLVSPIASPQRDGQITLRGRNFINPYKNKDGSVEYLFGKVVFESAAAAPIEVFNYDCDAWSNDTINLRIPEGIAENEPYQLYVETAAGRNVQGVYFTLQTSAAPMISSIEPAEFVLRKDDVFSLRGSGFGNLMGTISLLNEKGETLQADRDYIIDSWDDDEIKVRITEFTLPVGMYSVSTAGAGPSNRVSLYMTKRYTRMYALFVGINHFENNWQGALDTAVKDAEGLRDSLLAGDIWSEQPPAEIQTFLLTDGNATKENILDQIEAFVDHVSTDLNQFEKQEDCLIFLSFSTHGWTDKETKQSGICAYDEDGSIYDSEIYALLDRIPEVKKVMLMDACESGGFIAKNGSIGRFQPKLLEGLSNLIFCGAAHSKQPSFDGDFTEPLVEEYLGIAQPFGAMFYDFYAADCDLITAAEMFWHFQAVSPMISYEQNAGINDSEHPYDDDLRQDPQIFNNIGRSIPLKGSYRSFAD